MIDPYEKLKILDSIVFIDKRLRLIKTRSLIDDYNEFIKLFKDMNNTKKINHCHKKAIKIYKAFINDYPGHHYIDGITIAMVETHITANKLKDASKFADTLEIADDDKNRIHDMRQYGKCFFELGKAYHDKRKFTDAKKYYLKAQELLKQYTKESSKNREKGTIVLISSLLEQCKRKTTPSRSKRKRSSKSRSKYGPKGYGSKDYKEIGRFHSGRSPYDYHKTTLLGGNDDVNTEEGCIRLIKKKLVFGARCYKNTEYDKACGYFKEAMDTIEIFKEKYKSSKEIPRLSKLKYKINTSYKEARNKIKK